MVWAGLVSGLSSLSASLAPLVSTATQGLQLYQTGKTIVDAFSKKKGGGTAQGFAALSAAAAPTPPPGQKATAAVVRGMQSNVNPGGHLPVGPAGPGGPRGPGGGGYLPVPRPENLPRRQPTYKIPSNKWTNIGVAGEAVDTIYRESRALGETVIEDQMNRRIQETTKGRIRMGDLGLAPLVSGPINLPGGGLGCPPGYHRSFRVRGREGDVSCVRHRRTNYLNLRALNRAGRRVRSFIKIAKRYVSMGKSKSMGKICRRGCGRKRK